ncbi:hypothetical protein DPX16_16116 [Anabarilius grahami]|uniref:Uncharacterized protein n=1 Tax=Anabarilius grahami TaxID=495550 RepID=A0A3N0YNJ8_ANAGA|nr:hypothetical protein DPX16_16116 [Anabarilius grahami]
MISVSLKENESICHGERDAFIARDPAPFGELEWARSPLACAFRTVIGEAFPNDCNYIGRFGTLGCVARRRDPKEPKAFKRSADKARALNPLQCFQVLRQNADSVLADAVHVSSTTHSYDADVGAGQY